MRKVIESTLISLDGVVDDVGSWGGKYFDAAWWKSSLLALEPCDALLLGRNTYEMLAGRTQALLAPGRDGGVAPAPENARDYARRLDGIRKYVFSSTLRTAEWKNSVLVRGDAAAEVAKLKREVGNNMMIYGHGPLGQAMLEHGLLDELHFSIHPVLVGRGKVALRDNLRAELKLTESKSLANGVVVVSYEPIRS
jgi:dihydrofolate reductase